MQEEQIYKLAYEIEQIYEDNSTANYEFECLRSDFFQKNSKFLNSINQVSNKKELLALMFILFRGAVFAFNQKWWIETIDITEQIIYLSEEYCEEFGLVLSEQDFYKYALQWIGVALLEQKKYLEARKYFIKLKSTGHRLELAKDFIRKCNFEFLNSLNRLRNKNQVAKRVGELVKREK